MTDGRLQQPSFGREDRLVYQVIGEDGPSANPRRIRFMVPHEEAAEISAGLVPGLFSAAGALGLISLGLSTASLGVSDATLQAARRIETRIDQVWLPMDVPNAQLQAVAQKLERIDVNVAEQNLRAALAHVLPRASLKHGYDLAILSGLRSDLQKFSESAGAVGYGLAANLSLSSDVRSMLRATWHLVYGAQLSWIAAHNRAVGGDPERSKFHPMDYACLALTAHLPMSTLERVQIDRIVSGAAHELGDLVYNRFSFAGEKDRKNFAEWLGARVIEPSLVLLDTTFPLAGDLAVELADVLPDMESDDDVHQVHDWILDYLTQWIMTDAGLLWRTAFCLETQLDRDFWSELNVDYGATPWFTSNLEEELSATADTSA